MRIFASRHYVGTDEESVARVAFAVGEAVWCLYYPSRDGLTVPLSLNSSQSPKNAYIYLSRAYLNVSDCVTYIWPVPMA